MANYLPTWLSFNSKRIHRRCSNQQPLVYGILIPSPSPLNHGKFHSITHQEYSTARSSSDVTRAQLPITSSQTRAPPQYDGNFPPIKTCAAPSTIFPPTHYDGYSPNRGPKLKIRGHNSKWGTDPCPFWSPLFAGFFFCTPILARPLRADCSLIHTLQTVIGCKRFFFFYRL